MPTIGLQVSQRISAYGTVSPHETSIEYGFNDFVAPYNDFTNEPWKDKVIESGAKWIRLDTYQAESLDLLERWKPFFDRLHAVGLKILVLLSSDIKDKYYDHSLEQWRSWVRTLVTAVDGHVDAWEIWNEPDLPQYCVGYMDGSPERYFNTLKAAYEEIRAINPTVPIVAGSLATLNEGGSGPGDYWGGTLLKGIWALGAQDYCDAVSIHTYQFWLAHQGISAGEAIEMAYNITHKPIWNTELGTPSEPKTDFGNWGGTEEKQQQFMLEAFTSMENAEVKPEVVFWFTFYTYRPFALLNADYSEKIAYGTFKEFATPPHQ